MKTLSILAAVIILSLAQVHAELQPSMPMRSGKYIYKETVAVDGGTAADLHNRARMWAHSAYGSGPEVIQVDDPSSGRLVLNGLVNVVYLSVTDVDVRHKTTIEVEDGSYSYAITDFAADFGNAVKPMEEQWSGRKSVKSRVHKKMTALIERLKKQMTQSTPLEEPADGTVGAE